MLGSEYTWITLALFTVLGLIVWKGMGPILASLDARGARIKKEIDEAQSLREEAQKMLAEYKRKQRDAIKEAEEIVEHAKAEAERLRKTAEADLEASLKRRE
jgi:F-type H+-transporting ATPase subunit b